VYQIEKQQVLAAVYANLASLFDQGRFDPDWEALSAAAAPLGAWRARHSLSCMKKVGLAHGLLLPAGGSLISAPCLGVCAHGDSIPGG
jgi:hypothetical protein